MNYKKTLATICLSGLMAGQAFAGVSQAEADKLGGELTPMGAIAAGNADGSIPAWNPEGVAVPGNFVEGSDNYVNPYADDKPLLTIDASNWEEHADKLTEGTKGLFKKLGADGFKMDVYPSRRDFVAPDWLYDNNRKNATATSLATGGLKVNNNLPGVPFPIPKTGDETIWNHMIRYQTDHSVDYATYYVGSNGKPVLASKGYVTNIFPMYKEHDQVAADEPWGILRINYLAPARRAGEILLVQEPGADFSEGKGRKAWQYLTGQRRVRQAPAVSFDTPNTAVAGTSTYDDTFVYNGSTERYDWKLLGLKETYVPYNNYDYVFGAPIEDILGEKFLKPEYIRWELHRTWVVEATLKDDKRHLYKTRRYYLDEDTWAAVAGETYDGRDNLWRVHYAYLVNLYDKKSRYDMAYGSYDLLQNLYNVNFKPIPGKFKNGVDKGAKYFTSKGMARSGIR